MFIKKITKKVKKSILSSSSGLTLIELMVVVSILALVTLGLVTLFSGGVRSYISGDAQLEAQRNARQAMDRMVKELRHGHRVTSFDPNNPVAITVEIPTIEGVAGYNVTYSWSGTPYDPIERTVSGGTTSLINDVLNVEFDNSKSSRINILLEVDVDRDNKADISLDTAVNLRNF